MEACNLCGGTDWTTIEAAGPTRVVRCTCGLVFVTPQPPRPLIAQAYDQSYYSPWEEQATLRAGIWQDRMHIAESVSSSPGTLLDVGCGTGTFLRLARERGWTVIGTELSSYATRQATATGLKVFNGELWDAKLPDASVDVVTCWHVLEHVTDPRRVLADIYRVLRPGGHVLLATPNLYDYVFRLAYILARRRRPKLYEPNERELHLFHFSPQTLRTMLATAAFGSVEIGYDRGAAAVWGKRFVNELAYVWFMLTGLHWGMGLMASAIKPSGES